jgi:hypothetical protein
MMGRKPSTNQNPSKPTIIAMKNTIILHSLATLAFLTGVQSLPAAVYSQSFTAPDGTTGAGLGDGSFIDGFGSIRNNALELAQDGVGGTMSTFVIPVVDGSSQGFTVSFDLRITSDVQGGGDGLSFAYGNGMGPLSIFGEEGALVDQSVSWIIDTFNNSGDAGVRTRVNGVNDFHLFGPILKNGAFEARVTLGWNPTAGMTMKFGSTTLFEDRAISGFIGNDDFTFGFGSRTGGASETVLIDNFTITTAQEPSGVPEGGSALLLFTAGLVGIEGGRRRLKA